MSKSLLLIVGLLTFAASLLRHAPTISSEVDLSQEASVTIKFEWSIQKAWVEGGFFALDGQPLRRSIPTNPVSGETYVNHPPLLHWIYRLPVLVFGNRIEALQYTAAFICAALCAFIVVLCAQQLGSLAALTAFVFLMTSPMLVFYGRMASFECPIMLVCLGVFMAARVSGWKSAIALVGLSATAIMIDWIAGFLVFGVFVVAEEQRWRRVFLSGLGVAIGIIISLGLFRLWTGPDLVSGFVSAYQSTQATGFATPSDFMSRPLMNLYRFFGILPLLVLFIGLPGLVIRVWTRQSQVIERLALAFLVIALAYVLAFPRRTYNHEFWWIYFTPTLAFCLALLVQRLGSRKPILAWLILLILPLQLPFTASYYNETARNEKRPIISKLIEDRYDADTLLLFHEGTWNIEPDVEAWIIDEIRDFKDMSALYRDFQSGRLTVTRLVFCFRKILEKSFHDGITQALALGATRVDLDELIFLEFHRKPGSAHAPAFDGHKSR